MNEISKIQDLLRSKLRQYDEAKPGSEKVLAENAVVEAFLEVPAYLRAKPAFFAQCREAGISSGILARIIPE